MNLATSSPRIYTDEHKVVAATEIKRYLFDNAKKIRVNPCESAEKKLQQKLERKLT
jgi:hypothetical protein